MLLVILMARVTINTTEQHTGLRDEMYTVNEFLNGKWVGYWIAESESEARKIVDSLKIGRKTKSYNIENQDGTVVDIFKAHNAPE